MRVLKWPVPVDDDWHPVGSGPVAHVDLQDDNVRVVYVWTVEPETGPPHMRGARVYGTGHKVPDDLTHLGSTVSQHTGLVWHLFGVHTQ